MPKTPIFKSIYFLISGGHNRVISKTEILGRIIYCGFEIIEYFECDNLLYVISKKIANPKFDIKPSYGLLFKMNRIGYKGKTIGFYVFGRSQSDYPRSYVRVGNDPKVYLADQNVTYMLQTRPTYWGEKPKEDVPPPLPTPIDTTASDSTSW